MEAGDTRALGSGAKAPDTGAELKIPLRLEHYLPPDLWCRLTSGVPRRGVLLNALERLRSVCYLLSTYLPRHLVQEKMRRPVPGLVRGRMLSGSLLFADVSGFTPLSERLAQVREGPEQLTELMNRYFSRMIDILSWSGGILLKFAGDALLVYFPQQKAGEQARWAVRAGQRMMQATFAPFSAGLADEGAQAGGDRVSGQAPQTRPGLPDGLRLRVKIGIATGEFMAASVGDAERMEYVVLGEAVARTMAAEGAAEVGQVIVDGATAAHLDPDRCLPLGRSEAVADFRAIGGEAGPGLDAFEIRAERRRSRGGVLWNVKPHALVAQMEIALRQIEALTPYLAPELVERVVTQARQRRVESEFRPTTVLFLNVVGLESLLASWRRESADPAGGERQVTRLLNEYFRAMQRIVARHGGVVSRIDPYSQGSKMLILFGAPVAHEDDPLRAVGAALAMNDELAALNDRWRRRLSRHMPGGQSDPASPLLWQRMGLTQGDTFAGQAGSATRREYTVMGDDVNLAARLMAAAQPGQVLLSQRVYDAVVDHFTARPLPPIRVKGKSQPIPIYEPVGLRDDPLARRLRHRGPLMGRDAELARMRAVLDGVLNGQGMVWTIAGPAGVGKSHLADKVVRLALARQFRVLFAACRSYAADAPYAPWVALLQGLMGTGPDDPPETCRDRLLHTLSGLDLALEAYAGPLGTLLDVPPARLAAVPEGATTTGEQAPPPRSEGTGGRPQPVLFARLSQKVTDRAGTYRRSLAGGPDRGGPSNGGEKGPDLWRLVRERQEAQPAGGAGRWSETLQARTAARRQERLYQAVGGLLARLSAESPLLLFFESGQWMDPASEALIESLSDQIANLPVLLLVVRRLDGPEEQAHGGRLVLEPLDLEGTALLVGLLLGREVNPDLARSIQRLSGGNPLYAGEIVGWMQRSGQTTLEALDGRLRASVSVQELVLSHLDSLPQAQGQVARCASVVGTEFPRGAVDALVDPPAGGVALADHLAHLEADGLIFLAWANGDHRYAFRQTLVREVAYHSQSFARRRALHGRLADYLERPQAGEGPEPLAQVRQGHLELLAHHCTLAGRPGPAARYLILCGHKARQRYAYTQAKETYGRALAALDGLAGGEGENGAETLRSQAHEGQGDVALLTGELAAAAAAYRRALAGGPDRAGLLVKLALVLPGQGRAAEAIAHARQAWVMEETGRDPAAKAAVAMTLAWILWRNGDSEAGDWIEQAQGLLGRNGGRGLARAGAMLADLAGDWAAAQEAYLRADLPAGAALAACREGDRCLQRGEPGQALVLYDRAAGLWEREADGTGLALARYRQAEARSAGGDLAAARQALEEALSLQEAAPDGIQDDRRIVVEALAAVADPGAGAWHPWRWQSYEDGFRLSLLCELVFGEI